MRVTVLYFASLREKLGCASEQVELPQGVATLADLRIHLAGRGEAWTALVETPNLRMAMDQAMAKPEAVLRDGAEVAFFPPVTGG